jgi:hypothetical protein
MAVSEGTRPLIRDTLEKVEMAEWVGGQRRARSRKFVPAMVQMSKKQMAAHSEAGDICVGTKAGYESKLRLVDEILGFETGKVSSSDAIKVINVLVESNYSYGYIMGTISAMRWDAGRHGRKQFYAHNWDGFAVEARLKWARRKRGLGAPNAKDGPRRRTSSGSRSCTPIGSVRATPRT